MYMGEGGEDDMYGEEGEDEDEDPADENIPESATKRPRNDWGVKSKKFALYYSKWIS